MGNDATEAALGLLGLTSATFDTAPTVPLKRKQSPSSSSPSRPQEASFTSAGSDTISCICGFTYDDGFSIGCDSCSRWCHAACFGIIETEVPEEWQCWVCSPRIVDKERAVRLQKSRQKAALSLEAEKQRRRMSPGVDRKGRKTSGPNAEGGAQTKRKRRASTTTAPPHEDEHVDIDEPWSLSYVHINTDIIPHDDTRDKLRRVATQWRGVTALKSNDSASSSSPVFVQAGESPSSPSPLINLRPLPSSSFFPSISANLDPSIRPPSYSAHTVRAVPTSGMITPYVSTITPSTTYLADPLNAYAHLSMPKPFVHLIGPPLDVALDSRTTGNWGRFVRSGCRPNAVLRPVLCPRSKARTTSGSVPNGTQDGDRETLTFGVFALRDLKAHEEVVLGWEWDDGSVVHQLPALIDSPHVFPSHEIQHIRQQLTSMLHVLSSTFTTCACGSKTRDCALARIAEFVDSQTPPTPSPSPPTPYTPDSEIWGAVDDRSRARSNGPEVVSKKRTNLGPLIGVERGFRTRERIPWSGGMGGVEMIHTSFSTQTPALPAEDLDVPSHKTSDTRSIAKPITDRKGKGKARDTDFEQWEMSSSADVFVDHEIAPKPQETNLPPKLRKQWIRKTSDSLRATHGLGKGEHSIGLINNPDPETGQDERRRDEPMDLDEPCFDPAAAAMPPPPLPARLAALSPRQLSSLTLPNAPVTSSSTDGMSPSTRFAKLSLLSPLTYPLQHFPVDTPRRTSTSPPPPPAPGSPASQESDDLAMDKPPSHSKEVLQPALFRRTRSNAGSVFDTGEEASIDVPPSKPSTPEISVDLASGSPPPYSPIVEQETRSPVSPSSGSQGNKSMVDELTLIVVSENRQENHDGATDIQGTVMSPTDGIVILEEPATASQRIEQLIPEQPPIQRSLSPPRPPSPPKVKMSLKDFALRKKKRREEEASKAVVSPAMNTMKVQETLFTADVPSSQSVTAAQQISQSESRPAVDAPLVRALLEDRAALTEGSPVPVLHGSPVVAQPPLQTAESRLHKFDDAPTSKSFELKVETMEPSVPDGMPTTNGHAGSSSPLTTPPPTDLKVDLSSTRDRSPISDGNTQLQAGVPSNVRPQGVDAKSSVFVSRTPQASEGMQEDGEIISPPPKSLPLPAARSNSPPTHPRSFYPPRAPANFGPRRPFRHQTLQNTLPPDRHLPNAPRALRGLHDAPYSAQLARPLLGPLIPRGPSADRDRVDWDRERAWVPSARGRGRGSSNWNR